MRLGFIGAGRHACNHLRQFARLPEVTLGAIYDMDAQRARAVAAQFSPMRAATGLGEILEDASIDAVVIATPAETHRQLTVAALSAGKHVLLEKPLAHTPEDGLKIVEAAAAHPRQVVLVGHCERFNRAYIDARKAIDDGCLGEPRFASATRLSPLHLNNPDWKLGVLDTAIHDIDLMLWLMGSRATAVSAEGATANPELTIADHVAYSIRFENGALAQGHIGWLEMNERYPMSNNAHPRLFLAGSTGFLQLDLWQRPVSVYAQQQNRYFWPDDVLIGFGDYFTEVTAQDYAFVRAVSAGAPLPISVREAYEALRVAHEAHRSLVSQSCACL